MTIRAPRTDTWLLGAVGLLAMLTGLLAGVDGRLAIAAALAAGFALAALANLTVALALFTFLGFVIVVPSFSGPMQDVVQVSVTIPLLLSWLAVVSREGGSQKTFIAAHPAVSLVMLMLVAWTGLSLIWAEDGGETLRSVFRWGLALFVVPIVFTAVRTQRDVTMIMAAVVAGAVGAAAYGFLDPAEAPGLDDRFSGTLGDPNYLASAMVVGIGLSGGLAAIAKTPLGRGAALGSASLCVIAILLTGSRGGLIALGATLIAAVALTQRRRFAMTVIALTVALVAVGYVTTAAPERTRERILNPGSGSGRVDIWTVGGRMVSANPISGVGAGNFEVASIHYLLQPGSLPDDQFIADTPQVAHNTYLEVVAELGFPGAILFLTLIVFGLGCLLSALSRFRALKERRLQALTTAIAISLVGLLVADVFLSNAYSRTLWLLVGLGPALLAMAKRMEPGPAA